MNTVLKITIISFFIFLFYSCAPKPKSTYEVTYLIYYNPEKPDTFKVSVLSEGPGRTISNRGSNRIWFPGGGYLEDTSAPIRILNQRKLYGVTVTTITDK